MSITPDTDARGIHCQHSCSRAELVLRVERDSPCLEDRSSRTMAAVNIPAVLIIIFYYFTVMYVGVWGGRKVHVGSRLHESRRKHEEEEEEDFLAKVFVANREVPLFLGIGSMTGESRHSFHLLVSVAQHGIFATERWAAVST